MTNFIEMVKLGKTAIVFAQDYVVLDKKTYDNLVKTRYEGLDTSLVINYYE